MNKWKLVQRVIGFVLLAAGIFMLAVYPGITSVYAIDAAVVTFCGILMVLFSASGPKGVRPARPSEFDKRAGRRIILFTLLYFVYIIAAFYVLYRAETLGTNTREMFIRVGIGYAAVTGAYILLLSQLIRERKENRIQDPVIGALPAYENRRLFSMVGEAAGKDSSVWLKGILHGEVKPGDKAWIIDKGHVYETTVEKTETEDRLSILSVKTDHTPIGPFPVITSMIPYRYTGWETPITNPELFSLIEGAGDHPMSSEYLSHLIYAMAHSRYLVRVSEAEKPNTSFQKFSTWLFGYHGNYIPETVMLKNESTLTCSCYTDWNAFGKVLSTLKESDRTSSRALILTFQQIADAAEKNRCPIVINPFGPSPFRLSRELLRELLNNDAYQKEFGGKKPK